MQAIKSYSKKIIKETVNFDEYYKEIKVLISNLKDLDLTATIQYKNLLIVLKLCENSPEYKQLLSSSFSKEIQLETIMKTIDKLASDSNLFNNSPLKENAATLLEIFKNRVYVGERIARCFSSDCLSDKETIIFSCSRKRANDKTEQQLKDTNKNGEERTFDVKQVFTPMLDQTGKNEVAKPEQSINNKIKYQGADPATATKKKKKELLS